MNSLTVAPSSCTIVNHYPSTCVAGANGPANLSTTISNPLIITSGKPHFPISPLFLTICSHFL